MAAPIGETLGVEEEYHLVEPGSFALAHRPELVTRVADAGTEGRLRAEMLTSQLEATTEVCTTLDEVRATLVAARSEATAVAHAENALLLGTSTHPFAGVSEIEVLARPRYARLVERFGAVVGQFNLVGCHVHVGVPDLDTAVAVMTRARPYLPLLAALTGSSPFHDGYDTGWNSYRLALLAMWPQGGMPPALGSAAEYSALVDELQGAGLVDDASTLLWELRPSVRYPTLEFRIADMCPSLDDAVLYAGLVRSLVRTLGSRTELPTVPDAVLRAARWRAARYGLGERLWSPSRRELVPAPVALDELWAELRPDLEEHGEAGVVGDLLDQLRSHGTSADRQRRAFAATGSLHDVARAGVELTARLE
jgi:carboxylate-amine ligase